MKDFSRVTSYYVAELGSKPKQPGSQYHVFKNDTMLKYDLKSRCWHPSLQPKMIRHLRLGKRNSACPLSSGDLGVKSSDLCG